MRSLAQQRVVLAHPHGSQVSARFMKCLVHALVWDAKHSRRLVDGGYIANSSGANIVNARNEIVEAFLTMDVDWLWFLDTDHTFDPDILDKMLKAAHPEKRPILGALAFSLKDGVKARPTIYVLREDGKVGVVFDYPRNTSFSAVGGQPVLTGTGCVLIHRSVFEKIRDSRRDDGSSRFPKPYIWFQETSIGSLPVGEDITFCVRAMACGFPITLATDIKIGHEKCGIIDESIFEAQMNSQFIRELPTYVVIPVKDRHDLTAHLLEQLATEGFAETFVFDNGSETPPPVAWNAIDAKGWSLHAMWNRGVEMALERAGGACNIAILNNDLHFPQRGFLDGLATALHASPQLVLVSPVYDNRPLEAGTIEPVSGICANRYDGTGGMAGFAFMVKGEWFAGSKDRLGYRFPEEFELFYGDNDLALSIEQAGGLMGIVGGVPVEHVGGGSQTPRPGDESAIMRRDGEKFKAKWSAA